MKVINTFKILFVYFFCLCVNGQINFSFDKLNSDKGLSQSIIYAINQDNTGNIWLATEEGVVRYNSKDAYIYQRGDGLPKEINNRILCLYTDSQDRLWIGTENGICIYNKQMDRFDRVVQTRLFTPVKNIIEDNKGDIILSTEKSIWHITDDKQGNYTALKKISSSIPESLLMIDNNLFYMNESGSFFYNTKNGISSKINTFPREINSISTIKKIGDKIFIGTKKGDLYLTDINFSFFSKKIEVKNNSIKDVIKYRNNYFVAVDGTGILVLNSEFKKVKQFEHSEDDATTLSSNGVYDLFVDKQGLFWVTTFGGGLNIFNPLKSNFTILRHVIHTTNSLSSNFCTSFLDVGEDEIWFGTKNGISIWNRKLNNWKHIKSLRKGSLTDNVLTMTLDGEYVWVGTYNNGLYKVHKQSLNVFHFDSDEIQERRIGVSKVFKVFKDRNGAIWIGGIDGKLTVIKKNNSIQIYNLTQVRDIFQGDQNKVVFVGRNGVHFIDDNNTIKEIKEVKKIKNQLDFVSVNCGIYNPNKNYIFGTNGGGLLIYNSKTNSINKITKENGLPSNVIQGMVEDDEFNYWVITTKGLSKISSIFSQPKIINFAQADGLSSNEFNNKAILKLKTEEILIGGINGVTLFKPSNIQLQKVLPEVVFEELLIFNKVIKPGDKGLEKQLNQTEELRLNYSQNSIEIRFAGILHGFNSKVKYSWILEGFDKKWNEPSTNPQVSYTNLSYGDYVFKVKASNKDGVWGAERLLKIQILRPWYASFVAYIFYILMSVGLFYLTIYITKLIELKKNKEEQINMLNNITHEIKTPLSILISSLENYENDGELKKKKLQPTIERLNLLIKQMLNFHLVTSEKYLPGNVEKILVNQYFNAIIVDFNPLLENKKLKVDLIIDSNAEVIYFEREDFDKIIFNLISNAIKYSFENNKIEINVSYSVAKTFVISIRDYGLGIPQDQQKFILNNYYRARNVANSNFSGTGLGLMIVKNLIDRNKGKISFESEENKGTLFKVELPSQESLYANEMLTKGEVLEADVLKENLDKYMDYKILIVEDNEELRRNLVNTLEQYFLVYEAVNGWDGLEKASQIFPDLILTDYIMPIMDGVQMCNQLKDDINLNHIPVFMMTVLQNSRHKQESIETGITEYLEKPLNLNILLAKINNLFNWQQILKDRFVQQTEVLDAEKFKTKKDSDFIEKLEAIILEKIKDETFTLSDICIQMGMSRTSLYMKLKTIIDVSPQDFIILTKLRYAKKIIVEGEINIKEVAYSSGFANPKYFSTSFKKMYGMTPSQYIKSLSNK